MAHSSRQQQHWVLPHITPYAARALTVDSLTSRKPSITFNETVRNNKIHGRRLPWSHDDISLVCFDQPDILRGRKEERKEGVYFSGPVLVSEIVAVFWANLPCCQSCGLRNQPSVSERPTLSPPTCGRHTWVNAFKTFTTHGCGGARECRAEVGLRRTHQSPVFSWNFHLLRKFSRWYSFKWNTCFTNILDISTKPAPLYWPHYSCQISQAMLCWLYYY